MQRDAGDQQDHAERDESDEIVEGEEGFHLEFSDPLDALVNLAMQKHGDKA